MRRFANKRGRLVNKAELINEVAQKAPHARAHAADVVDAVFDVMVDALKKREEIRIPNFGTFKVKDTAARVARNPQTGAEVKVPAGRKARFMPGKALKDALDGPSK
jgi:DNA-binding protein HU-beta